jgi:protein Mpv17
MHYWYRFLEHRLPGATNKAVLRKVALDQLCFAPPFYGVFFGTQSLLEGNDWHMAWADVESKWLRTMVADALFWPGCTYINFRFVPPAARVAYTEALSVAWDAFLSYTAHRVEHSSPHAAARAAAVVEVAVAASEIRD